ncbi:MAG: fused MFS/spermidine synthase [Anaerolineae bacterium]|nr:fused MFS/spermidine synthase [Anaerolineae bacterium]
MNPTPEAHAPERLHPLMATLIVFLSNFGILVLELVAGRLTAPIVGVSLYTWTSIIGIILAGISLGNYLGGKIADRWASLTVLAWLFVLSALGSASILWTIDLINPLRELELPIILGVLLIFTAVFLLPSTLLGTISPVVVKLTLADLNRTGDIVGKIYAAGAAGSIAGTFATGFFLISAFGTRLLVWGVAGGLLLIGALIGLSARRRLRYGPALLVGLFLALSVAAWQGGWLGSRCLRETDYYCIKVRPDDKEPNLRVLTLDRLVHSYVDPDDPTYLRYGYERVYAGVVEAAFPGEGPLSALFIGGGGYTFPRYLEVTHPGSRVEVIEIDPGVTETAYSALGLPADTTIVTFNEDARRFIANLPPGQGYDLIVGDAFNDFSVPYHLTTLEFDQQVAAHLKPDGLYLVNIIDGREGAFLRAYVSTLQQVFAQVYVSPVVGQIGQLSRQTYVLVAANRTLPIHTARPSPLDEQFVTPAELAGYLQQTPPLILTDDYVPVDNLLAPVFADSGL